MPKNACFNLFLKNHPHTQVYWASIYLPSHCCHVLAHRGYLLGFLSNFVRSLPYNMKPCEVTLVVNWRYVNTFFNWTRCSQTDKLHTKSSLLCAMPFRFQRTHSELKEKLGRAKDEVLAKSRTTVSCFSINWQDQFCFYSFISDLYLLTLTSDRRISFTYPNSAKYNKVRYIWKKNVKVFKKMTLASFMAMTLYFRGMKKAPRVEGEIGSLCYHRWKGFYRRFRIKAVQIVSVAL